MKCLCCDKTITSPVDNDLKLSSWHSRCIKKFFGTNTLPVIDISEDNLKKIAIDNVNKGLTVPGAQKKLSLHLTNEQVPRLTIVNYPTGYILKPQSDEYSSLPELEFLIMRMAQASGIKTVPFALMRTTASTGAFAYITKRIDRVTNQTKIQMLAMEDFCQLDGRLTEDKYRGSYERCAKIIVRYSEQPGLDLSELFFRVIFSFAIGNSDMHLKNFSLIENSAGSRKYILSPAYDMLSTNVVIPADKEQLALPMNDKKQNIRKKDFLNFADVIGIPVKSAEKMLAKVYSMQDLYLNMTADSYLPETMKHSLSNLIINRFDVLNR